MDAGRLTGIQTQSAKNWHLSCPGLTAQARPGGRVDVVVCTCPTCKHEHGYKCSRCSQYLPLGNEPGNVSSRTGRCVDTIACDEIVENKASTSPLMASLLASRAAGANARRDRRETLMTDTDGAVTEPKERKPRQSAKPKVGVCHFSGLATRGGQFAPGSDARLKSQLMKTASDPEAQAGDRTDALAEQIARGWLKDETAIPSRLLKGAKEEVVSTARIEQYAALVEEAKTRVEKDGAEAVIRQLTENRLDRDLTWHGLVATDPEWEAATV
jgi:hypothetical protein